MQITFNAVDASLTSDLYLLGNVLFSYPNHGPQTSLVGRVGWFDYRDCDRYLHSKYLIKNYSLLQCMVVNEIRYLYNISIYRYKKYLPY